MLSLMPYTTADALADAMREVNEARLVLREKVERLERLLATMHTHADVDQRTERART